MARRSRVPGQYDVPLFELAVVQPELAEPVIVEELAVYGGAVNIAYRATELGLAFAALNRANRSMGMQFANHTPHRQEFEQRYGRATDTVVRGSRKSENRHVAAAKRHFANAAGQAAMTAAGMPGNKAATFVNGMYEEFDAKYGVGIAFAKKRNAIVKQIKRSASIITGKLIK